MTNYVTCARRAWPAAEWIIGNGPYASVAYCGTTTVILFGTLAEAERAKRFIDRLACGHDCRVEHQVVDLRTTQTPAARGAADQRPWRTE